jgi:glycosyltransferase involved in cell wall biosynthesis
MGREPRVVVLLATHNGEKYLQEQIDSIANQTGDFKLDLIASDDGSHDNSRKILKQNNVKYYQGVRSGACNNFFFLLNNAGDSDYYSFSDQDDIWQEYKIQRAIDLISKVSGPALYIGSVVNQKNGEVLEPDSRKTMGFLRNKSQGCTMVLNKQLYELTKPKHTNNIIMHDWWVKIVASCVGTIVIDSAPLMTYRIHSNNDTGYPSKSKKILRALKHLLKFEMLTKQFNQLVQLESHLKQDDPTLASITKAIKEQSVFKRTQTIFELTKLDSKKTERAWIVFCSLFTIYDRNNCSPKKSKTVEIS